MVQRDYILRLIEELGRVVAGVADLRARGLVPRAQQLVDEAMHRMLGFGLAMADELPADKLAGLIRLAGHTEGEGRAATDRLVALGTLLVEAAAVAGDQGQPTVRDSRRLKALDAFLLASDQERVISPQVREAVDRLTGDLSEYDLTLGRKERLWLHYERSGQYARAEDWLFELLDDDQAGPHTIAGGIGFYERLLHLSDRELERGNLPREEVLAGLTQLRQRANG